MPLDKVEAFDLALLFLTELKVAMTDAATPGHITKDEWVALAGKVGLKAFGEFVD